MSRRRCVCVSCCSCASFPRKATEARAAALQIRCMVFVVSVVNDGSAGVDAGGNDDQPTQVLVVLVPMVLVTAAGCEIGWRNCAAPVAAGPATAADAAGRFPDPHPLVQQRWNRRRPEERMARDQGLCTALRTCVGASHVALMVLVM